MKTKLFLIGVLCLSACVQVDFKDDAIRPAMLSVLASSKLIVMDDAGNLTTKGTTARLSLSVGDKQVISIEYLNQYGVKEDKALTWASSKPTVATATNNEVIALASGTTMLTGSIETINIIIDLTVVGGANDVASVTVSPPTTTTLQIGQTIQLDAKATNMNGTDLSGKTFEWFSENSTILTVSASGLVSALANGEAEIHSKVDGVKSNSIKFTVGTVSGRMGTFQSAGGYSAKGSVTVTEAGGKLVVSLGADYNASVALGTFIYLANSTNGGTVKSAGLELGQWSNGAKTFEAVGVKLNQYKYVVVLCKPASVTFGFAELKP
jgi:uncharacterized protein YjdB